MIVNLHVTLRCNMRCAYCYAAHTSATMAPSTALAAVALAEAHASDIHIVYFGGEPLLERQLIEHVVAACEMRRRLTRKRYHHQLVTNGLLCDDSFLEFADRHGVSLCLSIDGTQHAHDTHRRTVSGEPTWERVTARIPAMLARNPYLHAQLVVTPATAGELDSSIRAITSTGIRFVSTSLDHTSTWDRAALRRLKRAYLRMADDYERRTLRSDRFFLSCFDIRLQSHIRGPCAENERCAMGVVPELTRFTGVFSHSARGEVEAGRHCEG